MNQTFIFNLGTTILCLSPVTEDLLVYNKYKQSVINVIVNSITLQSTVQGYVGILPLQITPCCSFQSPKTVSPIYQECVHPVVTLSSTVNKQLISAVQIPLILLHYIPMILLMTVLILAPYCYYHTA